MTRTAEGAKFLPFYLLSFPPEIIIYVLGKLDLRALLHCRLVSRFLRDVIDGSVTLQYKIELTASSMEDGTHSLLSVSERLATLRVHQGAWFRVDLQEKHVINMYGGTWELCDGIFAEVAYPRTLTFTRFPSPRRGIEGIQQWTLKDVGFNAGEFAFDPSQDVLAVLESQEEVLLGTPTSRRVHLLSLYTGVQHPAAAHQSLYHYIPAIPGNGVPAISFYELRFSGPYLCLMCRTRVSSNSYSGLTIWNWSSGSVLFTLFGTRFQSFAFLTRRHILVAVANKSAPDHLAIYDVLSRVNHIPTHVLQLPVKTVDNSHIRMHSDHARLFDTSSDPTVPFYDERDNRLFIVSILITGPQQIPYFFTLFLPLSTLLPYLTKEGEIRKQIPWVEWGLSGTRLVPHIPQEPIWIRNVQGTKCAHGMARHWETQSERPHHIRLFDFNLLSFRRGWSTGQNNGMNEREAHDRPEDKFRYGKIFRTETHIANGKAFVERVVTRLPFRDILVDVGEPFDAVMMTEDHLITVDEILGELAVYTL